MKSLFVRTASGLIYTGIIIGCILAGSYYISWLALALAILGCLEFAKITVGLTKQRMPALILDLAAIVCITAGPTGKWIMFWLAVICMRCVCELYIKDSNPIKSLAISLMSQIYIGIPCLLMNLMGKGLVPGGVGAHTLFLIFILIWVNDTGAFCVGSLTGRNKLFKRISPNKSWEGFFGGMAFDIIACCIFSYCCPDYFEFNEPLIAWILLGVLVTCFATWGDLVESLFKRTLCIKDSGSLIPGHGGILDRIDSFLLVMPASAVYLYFVSYL